jgi:hypothetical protein
MSVIGYIFLGIFGWMLGQYCTEPDEPPEPIKIVAPALNTKTHSQE